MMASVGLVIFGSSCSSKRTSRGPPLTRQSEILELSRSSLYYEAMPVSARDLELMRLIDEIHMKHPYMGSRSIRDQLQDRGYQVGRQHVSTLMRKMGIAALYQKPRVATLTRFSLRSALSRTMVQKDTPEVSKHFFRSFLNCALSCFVTGARLLLELDIPRSDGACRVCVEVNRIVKELWPKGVQQAAQPLSPAL